MKTIEKYEKTKTNKLKVLLNQYDTFLENTNLLIDRAKLKNENCDELEKMCSDYEIDASLIRMELTKRLWLTNKI
jgi:hypothetical protein